MSWSKNHPILICTFVSSRILQAKNSLLSLPFLLLLLLLLSVFLLSFYYIKKKKKSNVALHALERERGTQTRISLLFICRWDQSRKKKLMNINPILKRHQQHICCVLFSHSYAKCLWNNTVVIWRGKNPCSISPFPHSPIRSSHLGSSL